MIISHKYKYIFIQLEQTGSSSMAKELCKYYDGVPILWKHARYSDFLKLASEDERKYYSFSGVRNPLDSVVSLYFRHKFDPANRFKNLDNNSSKLNIKMFNFIKNDCDFAIFLKKFYYKSIYHNWKSRDFKKLNYVYKYENIQNDFSIILTKLNIKQIRPLPNKSRAINREKDFKVYYPDEIQGMAKIIFSYQMKKFNYLFPKYWAEPKILEYYFYKPLLYIKFILQIIWHKIIDNTYIHRHE